jgi:L-ascorbate metabolism protein UlaG (beta-lactamase superfamily)
MTDILKPFQLDIALLPINGNVPSRGVAGNMSAEEAARLGKEAGAKLVIPHHYNMFEFNSADPRDFELASRILDQRCIVLNHGQQFSPFQPVSM